MKASEKPDCLHAVTTVDILGIFALDGCRNKSEVYMAAPPSNKRRRFRCTSESLLGLSEIVALLMLSWSYTAAALSWLFCTGLVQP